MTFMHYNMQARRIPVKVPYMMHFLEEYILEILAISEAELREEVDLLRVQIYSYDLLTTRALHHLDLKVSRLVVYVKSNLRYDRLEELETAEDASIWLLFRRQGMRPMRRGCIYREQRQQTNVRPNLTGRTEAQIERWDRIQE